MSWVCLSQVSLAGFHEWGLFTWNLNYICVHKIRRLLWEMQQFLRGIKVREKNPKMILSQTDKLTTWTFYKKAPLHSDTNGLVQTNIFVDDINSLLLLQHTGSDTLTVKFIIQRTQTYNWQVHHNPSYPGEGHLSFKRLLTNFSLAKWVCAKWMHHTHQQGR